MSPHSTQVLRAVAFAALITLAGCSSSAEERLLQRVERAVEPSRFAFTHVAASSAAAGCVRPFLRFRGVVDYDRRLLAVSDFDSEEAILTMNDDHVLLSSSLFEGVTQPWVRIPRPIPDPLLAVVERALGPDLAPYVTATDLPPSGIATVADALAVASSVRDLDRNDAFRVTVDTATEYAEIEAIDAEIDEQGRVRSIAVLADTTPSDSGRGGWTIEYDNPPEAPSSGPPAEAADGEALESLGALELRPLGCELPQ